MTHAPTAPGPAPYDETVTAPTADGLRPVALVGPTASGKSAAALALAERWGGEIVNCDAMQQYRGMDIGTAKTPVEHRRGIAHHQLDVLDVTETATVARYQEAAIRDVDDILARGRLPIVVGGSMMYVQSLFDEWAFPPRDPEVRARWEKAVEEHGAPAIHERLREVDPVAAETILPSDGRRIVRALEVIDLTGRPFAASKPQVGRPRWGALLVGLAVDPAWLSPRIARRTEAMFAEGLIEETEALCTHGLLEGVTARQAIGYRQALEVLEGMMTRDEAIERTTIRTRQYVRRQRSWFGKDPRIEWLGAASERVVDDLSLYVEKNIHTTE